MSIEKSIVELEFRHKGSKAVDKEIQNKKDGVDELSESFIKYERNQRNASFTEDSLAKSAREAARAESELGRQVESNSGNIIAQRYALYDLSSTYAVVGAALAGVGIYATVVGAQFESAFTNVERTLDPSQGAAYGISQIRQELIGLSGQIPLTFQELSQIATIGNQMGIAAEDLTGFTSTVARFASVSGMSIDSVTQAFGGIAAQTGLASEYFENLGSSIALVGRESNATEAQLVSVIREVAAGGAAAGLAVDEIVGLAGALASLQVPPERARGAIDMYFGRINKAVAEGGPQLETWAGLLGKTTQEVENMVRAGDGAELLQGFLGAIQGLDAVDMGKIFGELDTDALRLANTLQRLGQNAELLPRYLNLAESGFMEGAELNRQYAMTVQDLNSQWIIFINGINGLIDAISGGAIPSLAGLLMGVNNVIFAFRDFLDRNPWVAKILAIGGALITAVGIMAIMRGATFALQASLLAYRYVAQQAAVANITLMGTLRGAAGALFGTASAAGTATVALRVFRIALAATGVGLLAVGLGFLGEKLLSSGGAASDAAISMDQYNGMMQAMKSQNDAASESAKNLANGIGGSGGGGGAPSVADAAKEATEEIRTLVDYAQDLAGVFSRSYELRFSSQSAMDTVTLKWIELNEQIAEYERKVRSLTADRSLKAYWLSVAELYNDQLRAGQLREEIAKIDDDLAEANAGASRELVGNSRAAIENRQTMAGLVDGYEDYIVALAKSGASQEFIQQEIKRLNSEFVSQATQLGYNTSEIQGYSAAFDDFNKIVASVPRDITIAFTGDPAMDALNEFFAEVEQKAIDTGNAAGGGLGGGIGAGVGDIPTDGYEEWLAELERAMNGSQGDMTLGWDKFWYGFNQSMIVAGVEIAAFFSGLAGGIEGFWDAVGSGGNPLEGFMAGFDETSAQVEQELRNRFGVLGWAGADAMNAEFEASLNLGDVILDGVEYSIDPVTGALSRVGAVSAEEYNASLGEGILPGAVIVDGINYAQDAITGEIYKVGAYSATDYDNGLADNLNPGDEIVKKINGASGSAKTAAQNAGASSGGGFWNSFLAQFDFGWLGDLFSGNPKSVKSAALAKNLYSPWGYASGGYTGAGAKYQPAGIVHRGEYVIPKQYVNQRTGLPDMSYVASLNNSKAAPKTSYATGGLVTGGMSGPVELGNYTLDRLARSVAVELRVGQQQLARATSDGNARLAQRGSN